MGNRSTYALTLAVALIAVAAACARADQPSGPPASRQISAPTATASQPLVPSGLPASLDDPICTDLQRATSAGRGLDGVRHVSFRSLSITPLSTATPSSGSVRFDAYANTLGGSGACLLPGHKGTLTLGGVHDFGSGLLLRVMVDMPPALRAESTDLRQSPGEHIWSAEFPMPQPGAGAVSTGTKRFEFSPEIPGRYDVVILSEWLDLNTQEVISVPNQSEVRTFTYYVLPD